MEKKQSQELGSRWQYACIAFLLRMHCCWLVRCILYIYVAFYTLAPSVRKRSYWYRKRRFHRESWYKVFAHTFALHSSLAHVLLDRLIFGVQGRFYQIEESPQQKELLEAMKHAPKGSLIVSAHVGPWHAGLVALDRLNVPVHVVGDHEEFEKWECQSFHAIDANDTVGCMIAVAAALAKGDIVCFMGDRCPENLPDSHMITVSLLGGFIQLPITPYGIAARTGADVYVLLCARKKKSIHLVRLEKIAVPHSKSKSPELYRSCAKHFAKALEDYVAKYPYQFFNFYDMWDIKRKTKAELKLYS